MKMYFGDLYLVIIGKEKEIVAREVDLNKSLEIIDDYCKEHNIPHYYTKMWQRDDGSLVMQFGDYMTFFILEE